MRSSKCINLFHSWKSLDENLIINFLFIIWIIWTLTLTQERPPSVQYRSKEFLVPTGAFIQKFHIMNSLKHSCCFPTPFIQNGKKQSTSKWDRLLIDNIKKLINSSRVQDRRKLISITETKIHLFVFLPIKCHVQFH